jgi:hypothetical protein
MFRLDYLSCLLTVVATILVGRKMWTGLVVSCVNSVIVCVIALHTSQYGFVPANVFCICINAFSLRAWLKVQPDPSASTMEAGGELVAGGEGMSASKNENARGFRAAERGLPIDDVTFTHVGWIEPNRHAFANVTGQVE